MQTKDSLRHLLADGGKRNDFCQTTQKLWPKCICHHFYQLIRARCITSIKLIAYPPAPDIGRKDDYRIGKISLSTKSIVYFPLIHHL